MKSRNHQGETTPLAREGDHLAFGIIPESRSCSPGIPALADKLVVLDMVNSDFPQHHRRQQNRATTVAERGSARASRILLH